MHAFVASHLATGAGLPPPKFELVPGMDSAAALPAQARPVSHSAALATDYPACGGVPQCIMAAAKPRVVVPGRLWGEERGPPTYWSWCPPGAGCSCLPPVPGVLPVEPSAPPCSSGASSGGPDMVARSAQAGRVFTDTL